MNMTEKSTKYWIQIIGSLGVIIGLIAGGFYFAYDEWYNTPKLTYETLDSYPLSTSEQIVPIIIRNEGHEKATNVRITVYASGDIQNVQEKTPEELKLETSNNTLIANLPRLIDNSQITFYLQINTFSQKPINDILITSDQCSGGIHETSGSDYYQLISVFLLLITLPLITSIFIKKLS